MWGGLMSVRREEGEHSSDLGRGGTVEAHGDGEALPVVCVRLAAACGRSPVFVGVH